MDLASVSDTSWTQQEHLSCIHLTEIRMTGASVEQLILDHNGDGRFTIDGPAGSGLDAIVRMDAYSAARAFVSGELRVQGDLCAAIRFFSQRKHSFAVDLWFSLTATVAQSAASWVGSRSAAARNIRFHYDRSNAFYRQFLDSRMLYSAADFSDPASSLDDAQIKKLDRICRQLGLRPDERFLDVGCGWGGLVLHAAEQFGVSAVGCTLSLDQLEFASSTVKDRGLEGRVTIENTDYRDLRGRFDKISSVGMFEHVGRRHMGGYFRKIYSLLDDRGMFLNRGIVRPENVPLDAATLFLQRKVFPGGELMHLADIVREAERAGFGVLEVQDFRRDYAVTCRAWVSRLLQNEGPCSVLVGIETYRTWLLYLAASAVSFEDGVTDAVQITLEKRPCQPGFIC
jgi:cyclopropane-fatty-acyl-phospholipid synthase